MSSTADGPELIPGIYHYCDRWCRRCPFTDRCLQFRLESEKRKTHLSLERLDVFGLPFWHELARGLEQATRLIHDATASTAKGAPGGTPFTEEEPVPAPSRRSARAHPLAHASLTYLGMVDDWFRDADAEERHISPAEDAVQVIRHYQYLIYPKIVRAIDGRMHALSPDDPAAKRDSEGSAKITLLAIDRSLAAWSILYGAHPGAEDGTIEILLHLDRIRRSLAVIFPDARDFMRPGFDTEVLT
ncbi:hypothetical protein [Pelodictyon luteolum]|uniref:Uncharacterized protein n=1 Tax=Chlorobium luteolum (strain DSM 273 / BCRC 81028 / 2530) TaxID=319225 RepID=Q3B695_CHLL3|nr:hypothetical protein [Pelodictyon luteolum]ABB23136.1 hypothetical protein Plut_0248 [Pelodictyon luteolum DSM 273]